VASRHSFPTCRRRGRNHEGGLADWTRSILADGAGERGVIHGRFGPTATIPAYRTAERRERRVAQEVRLVLLGELWGWTAGRASSDADDRIGLVVGGITLRLPESALPGSRLGLPSGW